jgi:hypothetical protein
VAQRLGDVQGIQWTTTGILSQAWPPDQEEVFNKARRMAAATLEDLRAKKRSAEADRFEKALNEALSRDCIAVVSWTGEADVDLMVKEPADTVCSLRNWRTTSGGMLVGDVPAPDGAASAQGHTAVYVCPQGFSGSYELLVRRVWGKVTTGKVTVEVFTHFGTPQARHESQKIALDRGEAAVQFDLADGRRKTPLADQQVRNAAVTQVAISKQQQVLSQQIQMLNDPQAQQQLAQAQKMAAAMAVAEANYGGQQGGAPFPWPFPTRGAVGYMPVIVVLPEGANMSATAVVSADRRYVRITCVPYFSAIAKVTTFSMDSGATSTQQAGGPNAPGTGGQGFSGVAGLNGAGGAGGGGAGIF